MYISLLPRRGLVIPSDYSTQLTYLLRYPLPSALVPIPASSFQTDEVDLDGPEHSTTATSLDHPHVLLFLRQALAMRASPTLATGAQIVYENRLVLGIPSEVPKPQRNLSSPSGAGRGKRGRGRGMSLGNRVEGRDLAGLQDVIVKNVLERGETVLGAISDMRVRSSSKPYALFD